MRVALEIAQIAIAILDCATRQQAAHAIHLMSQWVAQVLLPRPCTYGNAAKIALTATSVMPLVFDSSMSLSVLENGTCSTSPGARPTMFHPRCCSNFSCAGRMCEV